MKHFGVLIIMAVGLTGCTGKAEKREADAQLATAITRAMCAPTIDDLKLALGDVAVASDVIDVKARKGRVAELADQVTSSNCPGKPSLPPSSSLSAPADNSDSAAN